MSSRIGPCLISLLLAALAASGQSADPAPAGAEAGVAPSHILPFLTQSFLDQLRIEAERRALEAERRSGTYWHQETGLLWTQRDNGSDLDWQEAVEYCESLTLGGWEDWRLPTIEELETLHQLRSNATYKLPPQMRLTACCPWSSTRSGESAALNFSFRFRKRFSGALTYSYDLRALCARGPLAEEEVNWLPQEEEKRKKGKRSPG